MIVKDLDGLLHFGYGGPIVQPDRSSAEAMAGAEQGAAMIRDACSAAPTPNATPPSRSSMSNDDFRAGRQEKTA